MTQWSTLVGDRLSIELGSEDSTALYTSARRAQACQEGEREFARLTECLIRQTTITCSNGVGEYDLLSTVNIPDKDFAHIAGQQPEYALISSNSTAVGSTTHVAGRDFPRVDIETLNRDEPGWRSSTGAATPQSWYLRRDGGRLLLGVYPPTAIGSSQSGSLIVPYVATPTQTTISTATTLEPFTFSTTAGSSVRSDLRPYHQALVHYGASVLLKARRDMEASDMQLQKFLGYVTAYLQEHRPRGGRRASMARSYFRDAQRRGMDRRYLDPRIY